MNDGLEICIVCPLTTKLKYTNSRLIINKDGGNKLKQDSEVLVFQIRTVAKERLLRKIGEITEEQLERIVEKLNDVLKY